VAAYRVIRKEVKDYGPEISDKPEIIAFNKIDAISEKDLDKKIADFKKKLKKTPILISGATGKNVDDTMKRLLTVIQKDRSASRNQDLEGVEVEDWRP
jgi:GTPase